MRRRFRWLRVTFIGSPGARLAQGLAAGGLLPACTVTAGVLGFPRAGLPSTHGTPLDREKRARGDAQGLAD